MDRRSILQSIGTGVGIGAFSGIATAASDTDDHSSLDELDIRIRDLNVGDTRRYYETVRKSRAGEAMTAFLADRIDTRGSPETAGSGCVIVMAELTGTRVSAAGVPEHVRLTAPLRSSRGNTRDFVEFRLLKNDAVTAEAFVGGRAYKTHPALVHPNRDLDGRTADIDDRRAIVTALEWHQQVHSSGSGVRTADATNCDSSWTFENNSAACQLLSGLTAIAGAVLTIVPEPGTTAVGTVSIAGVLSGTCTVIDAVDQLVDDCNVNEITICAYQPCWYCTPQYYAYPSDCV